MGFLQEAKGLKMSSSYSQHQVVDECEMIKVPVSSFLDMKRQNYETDNCVFGLVQTASTGPLSGISRLYPC